MNQVYCSPFKTPSTKLHAKSSHPGLKIARQAQLNFIKNINRNQQELNNLEEKLDNFQTNKITSP